MRDTLPRRKLLQALGVGTAASLTGYTGNHNARAARQDDYVSEAKKIGYDKNVQKRRMATFKEWPMSARKDTPPRQDGERWGNYNSLKQSPWKPPEGWKDTIAGDVDQLKILNHGAVTMSYDPATKATHEKFEEETGIDIEPVEMGVSKANVKEQQIFQAKKGSPVLMNVNGPLVPLFAKKGWLAPVDFLYPGGMSDHYIPALKSVTKWNTQQGTHRYGFPNITEASLGHLRPDLVAEQGFNPDEFQGEWSWDKLEALMKAFKGQNVSGYAFYAGDATYFSYSFRELLYQQGGRLVQDDGTVKINTKPAVNVLERMNKWYSKGWVPGDVTSYAEGDIIDLFRSGQLAFATGMSDFVPRALDQFNANEGYFPTLPPKATVGPNPQQAALVDPNATAINTFAPAKKKVAATLYGDLRLAYDSQWWEFTYEGNMSYIDQVYKDAAQKKVVRYGDILGQAIDNGQVELFYGMQAMFQQLLVPAQEAITGNRDPKKALDQVQKFVDNNINTS